MVEKIQRRVIDSYGSVRRWTRKIDIFSKEYLVIPINAYKHWNCMIIVGPNSLLTDPSLCKILYLDSMFEKKCIFPEAIKKYSLHYSDTCSWNCKSERAIPYL